MGAAAQEEGRQAPVSVAVVRLRGSEINKIIANKQAAEPGRSLLGSDPM